MWTKNLLNELRIKPECITINIDNKAAVYNNKNETIDPKSLQIDISYHKIIEVKKESNIGLRYIKSQNNFVDGFTKYLNGSLTRASKNFLSFKIENIKFTGEC